MVMKHLAAYTLCAALLASPAMAEDDDSLRDGMDLLSEGTKLLLKGLLGELEPALRDLEGALHDLNAFHPPEILPNGDIIIRRKVPKVVPPGGNGEIEL